MYETEDIPTAAIKGALDAIDQAIGEIDKLLAPDKPADCDRWLP